MKLSGFPCAAKNLRAGNCQSSGFRFARCRHTGRGRRKQCGRVNLSFDDNSEQINKMKLTNRALEKAGQNKDSKISRLTKLPYF